MRRLVVFRHAKTVAHGVPVSDFERTLKERGFSDADAMGAWLAQQKLPLRLVSSPALRARQTAEIVARRLDVDVQKIVFDERIYEADVHTLLTVLADHVQHEAVVLVGHNPGLQSLVGRLAAPGTLPQRELPTSGVVILDVSEGLQAESCPVLAWHAPTGETASEAASGAAH